MNPVTNPPAAKRADAIPGNDITKATAFDTESAGEAATLPLARQVLGTLSAYAEDGELSMDASGTIVLAVDDVVLGVRVETDPALIRVFGVVEEGVPFDAARAVWLNSYNASRIPMGYVFWKDQEVIYTCEVLADPFIPEQLFDALEIASRLVPALVSEEELRAADGDFLE